MSQATTIDRLLNSVPDAPANVLQHLRARPDLASKQDSHGYSLLHAAASYGHSELLRALIEEFKVDPNLKDEDGETALFNVESVDMARELVQLGVAVDARNDDRQTAAEKLDDEDEQPLVAAFLRETAAHQPAGIASSAAAHTAGVSDKTTASSDALDGTGGANGFHAPPPVPNGLDINLGTMQAGEVGEAPDPAFRRRIEELAARKDFHEEAGQRELRDLVSQAVSGITHDERGSATRRRIG